MKAASSSLSSAALQRLETAVGVGQIATDEAARLAYARDLWPLLTLQLREGETGEMPAAVARPGTEEEVVALVKAAHESQVPLVAYGGGSGVVGGAMPVKGGISVDLKRLNRIIHLDPTRLLVDVQCGILGQTLEEDLNARGYTLGHFPSSIYCSTVGGFAATRSAGQMSSKYGKIEDMVAGLRVVTPGLGLVETGAYLPSGQGPDWTPAFVGSEGTLGLVTRVLLRIHKLPPTMRFRGFAFPNMEFAVLAMRKLIQRGMRPSVLRLYDPLDTWMAMRSKSGKKSAAEDPTGTAFASRLGLAEREGDDAESYGSERMDGLSDRLQGLPGMGALKEAFSAKLRPENLPLGALLRQPRWVNMATAAVGNRCLCVVGFEGDGPEVDAAMEETLQVFRTEKGVDLGADPGERWFRTRYHVSFKLPKALEKGAWVDTIEVATFWANLVPLYKEVKKAVGNHAVVMAHLSHAYHEGCSIYFTVAGAAPTLGAAEDSYYKVWDAALDATLRVGGTVTHHHGVGVLKKDWANREIGPARALYDALKAVADPAGICNPGKLFPAKN